MTYIFTNYANYQQKLKELISNNSVMEHGNLDFHHWYIKTNNK